MNLKVIPLHANDYESAEEWAMFHEENGEQMTSAVLTTADSRYSGGFLPTLLIGGVATYPEYRRFGCVRRILESAFEQAPERGWVVSLLHPFSFAYYRKFGYEKVSDHRLLEFPMKALDFVPRCPNLKLVDRPERVTDALKVYAPFAENRNIMFRRFDDRCYSLKPHEDNRSTYVWYNSQGVPSSYVTVGVEKSLVVNHFESVNLHVYEQAYTSPQSLMAILGFLRMYEGELDSVKIHNCAMCPELDFVLRHYTHTRYHQVPDVMARVLDVKALLEANRYPQAGGHFTIRVEDTLPFTTGTYRVEYEKGKAEVTRLSQDAPYDLLAPMQAFTQLVYGYEHYTADNAVYLPGVRLENSAEDFFAAFPKRNNGLFEHF